jgi:hypothetical protein
VPTLPAHESVSGQPSLRRFCRPIVAMTFAGS